MPMIYHAVKTHAPQLMLRNIPVNDAEAQLSQFQTDLIVDSNALNARALSRDVLFADKLLLVCRKNHPALHEPATVENLQRYEQTLLLMEGQNLNGLRQRINDIFPERLVNFSSYNIFTIAALIGSSDLLGIIPERLFDQVRQCWPVDQIPFAPLNAESVEISLYYNKLSLRDPVLENMITIIRQAF